MSCRHPCGSIAVWDTDLTHRVMSATAANVVYPQGYNAQHRYLRDMAGLWAWTHPHHHSPHWGDVAASRTTASCGQEGLKFVSLLLRPPRGSRGDWLVGKEQKGCGQRWKSLLPLMITVVRHSVDGFVGLGLLSRIEVCF